MKEVKDNSKGSGEHQAINDCSESVINDSRRFMFENQRLSAQLDFILSSIKGGCSPADAEFLRQMNHGFIAEMNERQAQIDELLR